MKRKVWENKAKSFKEAEEFDWKFWRRAGARARFEAAWSCIIDYYKMKGIHDYEDKLRLRRSVCRLKQT